MQTEIYIKTLKLFGNKGVRFTTDELARELGTSKRTLYTYFSTKDEIIEKTIDYVFEEMLNLDTEILNKSDLTIQEKIKFCFENIPDTYSVASIVQHMDDLQRYNSNLWKKVNNYLETAWDPLITLIEQGMKTNELKEVDVTILKLMLRQTQKKLLDYEFLSKNQISFDYALKAMGNIILYGLTKRNDS